MRGGGARARSRSEACDDKINKNEKRTIRLSMVGIPLTLDLYFRSNEKMSPWYLCVRAQEESKAGPTMCPNISSMRIHSDVINALLTIVTCGIVR